MADHGLAAGHANSQDENTRRPTELNSAAGSAGSFGSTAGPSLSSVSTTGHHGMGTSTDSTAMVSTMSEGVQTESSESSDGDYSDAELDADSSSTPLPVSEDVRKRKADPTHRKSSRNKRRNIRPVLDSKELNRATLLAILEEQQRLSRMLEDSSDNAPPPPSSSIGSVIAQRSAVAQCPPSESSQSEEKGAAQLLTPEVRAGPSDECDDADDDDVVCIGEPQDVSSEEEEEKYDPQQLMLLNPRRPRNEPEIRIAAHLIAVLKPHQISGIRFLFQNTIESLHRYNTSPGLGCILAHSMGLGKTLQTAAFIDVVLRCTPARRVLVLVPVNVLENWSKEFDQWFPPSGAPNGVPMRSFKVFLLNDLVRSKRERARVISDWIREEGVLVMGYECFCIMAAVRSTSALKPGGGRRKRSTPRFPPVPSFVPSSSTGTTYVDASIDSVMDEVMGRSDSTANLEVIDIEQEEILQTLLLDLRRGLLDPGPDLIICDEGHRIRNIKTKTATILDSVRTHRRVVLTGYPLQNNLREYWCMVNFVRPNFLGTKAEFCNMFERPIINGQCVDSTPADKKLMRHRIHVLTRMLRGFVQRRSHALFKDILPPKFEYVIFCRKTKVQADLYAAFMDFFHYQVDPDDAKMNPLRAFAVCCKIWNHPDILYNVVRQFSAESNAKLIGSGAGLEDLEMDFSRQNSEDFDPLNYFQQQACGPFQANSRTSNVSATLDYSWAEPSLATYVPHLLESSTKFQILFQILNESVLKNDKLLIFSQSLFALDTLEFFLNRSFIPGSGSHHWRKNESYLRLDGAVASSDRELLVSRFNSEAQIMIFLISTRAGSLGINLIGANRVVVLDASWNPSHDAQAVCRIYRYGQTKPCYIYRLITDNSMEKAIFNRQISKQGISENVVDQRTAGAVVTNYEIESLFLFDRSKDLHSAYDHGLDLSVLETDPLIRQICSRRKDLLASSPVLHESLILDMADQRLSKEEKREAQQQYRQELRQIRGFGAHGGPQVMFPGGVFPPTLTSAQARGILTCNSVPGGGATSKPGARPRGRPPTVSRDTPPATADPLPTSPTPLPGQIVRRESEPLLLQQSRRDAASLGGDFGIEQGFRGANSVTTDQSSLGEAERELRRRNCKISRVSVPRDLQLPCVNIQGISVTIRQGTPGYLVKTQEGTYFKSVDGNVYNAEGTILDDQWPEGSVQDSATCSNDVLCLGQGQGSGKAGLCPPSLPSSQSSEIRTAEYVVAQQQAGTSRDCATPPQFSAAAAACGSGGGSFLPPPDRASVFSQSALPGSSSAFHHTAAAHCWPPQVGAGPESIQGPFGGFPTQQQQQLQTARGFDARQSIGYPRSAPLPAYSPINFVFDPELYRRFSAGWPNPEATGNPWSPSHFLPIAASPHRPQRGEVNHPPGGRGVAINQGENPPVGEDVPPADPYPSDESGSVGRLSDATPRASSTPRRIPSDDLVRLRALYEQD